MKIIAYKKYTDKLITRTLALPTDKTGQMIGTDLATLSDGLTYVSVPATATLPTQAKEIASSVKTVTLVAAQIAEIKALSPHVKLINDRVCEKIRSQYTLDDELKMARISIGELKKTYTPSASELQAVTDYQVAVEFARSWGRAEKKKIGL